MCSIIYIYFIRNSIFQVFEGEVGATMFMSYHTPSRTSADFIKCIERSRQLAAQLQNHFRNKTGNENIEVFTYSVFYVFYEQERRSPLIHDTQILCKYCYSFSDLVGVLLAGSRILSCPHPEFPRLGGLIPKKYLNFSWWILIELYTNVNLNR